MRAKPLGGHAKKKPHEKRPEHLRVCCDCGAVEPCRCAQREDHVSGACQECRAG